jgi:hypothetical protein
MTFALYLHAPAHASDKPSYEIDSPAIVAWWDHGDHAKFVGGSCLIPVHDLARIIAGEDHGGLGDVLWVMEEASVVRMDRRE